MFDPTIYDNLKVVIEGAIYDLDLCGEIEVTNRIDRVELATMSRYYSLAFCLPDQSGSSAELRLWADTGDLAGEILETDSSTGNRSFGCYLQPVFYKYVNNDDIENKCEAAKQVSHHIWGDADLNQRISYTYGDPASRALLEISITFRRKFGEEVIEDIPQMIGHMLMMLRALNK